MGLSEQWIGVKGTAADLERQLSDVGLIVTGAVGDWTWARGWDTDALDELVPRLAGVTEAAVVGGWVADSDCAYLVFATPDGKLAAQIAINKTLPFGEPVEGLPDLWRDLAARGAAFEDLVRWSSEHAPSAVEASHLLREMPGMVDSRPPEDGPLFADQDPWYEDDGEAGWVFAEDGVRLIYHRLGLPGIDATVLAHRSSGTRDISQAPSNLGWLTVWGGDERLKASLAERLDSVADADVEVIYETLSPDSKALTRFARRYPEQDPGWVRDALELIRVWLSETGTEGVWVDLNSETTQGLSAQIWRVTPDDHS